MLARPRRRREVSGDEETQDEQLGRFTISVTPKKKRLFFLAKIDADDMMDKIKAKFPETWSALERSEAANAMKKKFDELTNPSFQPDRRRLSAVEDFFRYTEEEGAYRVVGNPNGRETSQHSATPCPSRFRWSPENSSRRSTDIHSPSTYPSGRRFFDEMDSDGDGRLKLEDLKVRIAGFVIVGFPNPFSLMKSFSLTPDALLAPVTLRSPCEKGTCRSGTPKHSWRRLSPPSSRGRVVGKTLRAR